MKVFEGFTNIFKSDDYDDDDYVNEEDYIVDEDDDDYETRSERRAKKDKVKGKKGSLFGSFRKGAKNNTEEYDESYYDADDYDADDYDDSYDTPKATHNETPKASTGSKGFSGRAVSGNSVTGNVNGFSETRSTERTTKVEQPRDRKVVPLRSAHSKGFEVVVIHPQSMDDGAEISETLLSGKAVILSLEGINPDVAQRIIDYTAGSCYAMRGNLQKISNYIFLVAPSGVDISGDFHDVLNSHTDTVAYSDDFLIN